MNEKEREYPSQSLCDSSPGGRAKCSEKASPFRRGGCVADGEVVLFTEHIN